MPISSLRSSVKRQLSAPFVYSLPATSLDPFTFVTVLWVPLKSAACLPSRFPHHTLDPRGALPRALFSFRFKSLIWHIERSHGCHGRIRHTIAVPTGPQAPRRHAHQDQNHHATVRREHSGMPVATTSSTTSARFGHDAKDLNPLVVPPRHRPENRPAASEQRRYT